MCVWFTLCHTPVSAELDVSMATTVGIVVRWVHFSLCPYSIGVVSDGDINPKCTGNPSLNHQNIQSSVLETICM